MVRFILFILISILTSSVIPGEASTSYGQEFYIGFLPMLKIGGLNEELSLSVMSQSSSTFISITSHGELDYSYSTIISSASTITKLSIPLDFLLNDAIGFSGKVIKILANSSIGINVYISSQISTEGYLALPKSSLMTKYAVVTQVPTTQSQFAIIGTENVTQVNITFPISVTYLGQVYSPQDVLTIALNQSQLFQFISSNLDLTGTWIQSDKPIMLVSGNKRKKFTSGIHNNLIEQLPPLLTWGVNYILNAFPVSDSVLFRIVAGYNNTKIYGEGKINTTLNVAQYTDVELAKNKQILLQCSQPCLVISYSRHRLKSSWMITVTPLKQFLNYYRVAVPELLGASFSGDIHVYIQIESDQITGLLLNNASYSFSWSLVNNTNISVAYYTIPAQDSSITLNHLDPNVVFGVGVYGAGSSTGLGYPGGQSLSLICKPIGKPADGLDNDCDYRVDEELPNGIDDDGDGRIDEDLILSPLQLFIPSNLTSRSCAPQNISSNPITTGYANATDDFRCTINPISYIDQITNSSCGLQIDRHWFVSDDCNTSAEGMQRIIIAYPLQEYLEPANVTVVCPEDLAPSSIGQPLVYDGQDCPGVKLPSPSITYQETRNQACQIILTRYWILKPTFLCGFEENYLQLIHLDTRTCGTICQNNATCIDTEDNSTLTCICDPGYTGHRCQTDINECASNPCIHGTCTDFVDEFTCNCTAGYAGYNCSEEINECNSNPCANGLCNDYLNQYSCSCFGGWNGTNCHIDIDECQSSPCIYGICQDLINGYNCSCDSGWKGSNCNINIDECQSSPCINGKCIDIVDSYNCTCDPGWKGTICSININECASLPCFNQAMCEDYINGYNCTCQPGWTGIHCQNNINECLSSPCQHGTCLDYIDYYNCTCEGGWSGFSCDLDINECQSSPCIFGTCQNQVNSFRCDCEAGYFGNTCEQEINECSSNPCIHGNCNDQIAAYNCSCFPGYDGYNCQTDINECQSKPCINGDCYHRINAYICSCHTGWAGLQCQSDIDECQSNPCQNGDCNDYLNYYNCTCSPGFTGNNCQTNIDDCLSSPCGNNSVCQDNINSYTCICSPGYNGTHCTLDIDECLSNPCIYGNCSQGINSFECNCFIGYTGKTCNDDFDECTSSPCLNGQCNNLLKQYNCTCSTGWTGTRCEIDIDECQSNPCIHGNCIDQVNGYTCQCDAGFTGNICNDDIDECSSNPCINGYCNNFLNEYNCTCRSGWTGSICTINVDECLSSPCIHGNCTDGINKFSCQCNSGYTGLVCNTDVNECTSNPCIHGNCSNLVDSYSCQCFSGWTGAICTSGIDECLSNPCINGNCTDEINQFSCKCFDGFKGTICNEDVDECLSNPCKNGQCNNLVHSYNCSCQPGWEGFICDQEINECNSSPCLNGQCVNLLDGFICQCLPGFTGKTCQTDINECSSTPCLNGNCRDFINYFNCSCNPGWEGTTCAINTDECISSPCSHNGTCFDLLNKYQCNCLPGYTGVQCETDINECSSSPCLQGLCTDKINGFTCNCSQGWTGKFCNTDINECLSSPCVYGGCNNLINAFTCSCKAGWTGAYCETEIDECSSNPCLNNGTCTNTINEYFCNCSQFYTGIKCETFITPCFNNPCVHGYCNGTTSSTNCLCRPGWQGSSCQQAVQIAPLPQLFSIAIYENNNAQMQCSIPSLNTGQGFIATPVNFTWLRNGNNIVPDLQTMIETQGTLSKLTMSGLLASTSPLRIRCLVANILGSSSVEADVTVLPSDVNSICPAERQDQINWLLTPANSYNFRDCPDNMLGNASRYCLPGNSSNLPSWQQPDLTNCKSSSLLVLHQSLKNILPGRDDLVLFNDIGTTVELTSLSNINIQGNLIESSIIMKILGSKLITPSLLTETVLRNYTTIASNILRQQNKDSWNYLQERQIPDAQIPEIIQNLNSVAERYSQTLVPTQIAQITQENIYLKVQRIARDQSQDFIFPANQQLDSTSRIILPSSLFTGESGDLESFIGIKFSKLQSLWTFGQDQIYFSQVKKGKMTVMKSDVLSASFIPEMSFILDPPVILHFQHSGPIDLKIVQPVCCFWNYTSKSWSDNGCRIKSTNSTHTDCQCTHLTVFSLLTTSIEKEIEVQGYVSSATLICFGLGAAGSLLTLVLSIIGIIKRRRKYDGVVLCLSIFFLLSLGLIFFGALQPQLASADRVICLIITIATHYTSLVIFFLIPIISHLYLSLSLNTYSISLKWSLPLALIIPMIPPGVAVGVWKQSYISSSICWLSSINSMVMAFIGPAGLMVLVTIIVLICEMVRYNKIVSTTNRFWLKLVFLSLWSLIVASDQIVAAIYFTYKYTNLEILVNVLIAVQGIITPVFYLFGDYINDGETKRTTLDMMRGHQMTSFVNSFQIPRADSDVKKEPQETEPDSEENDYDNDITRGSFIMEVSLSHYGDDSDDDEEEDSLSLTNGSNVDTRSTISRKSSKKEITTVEKVMVVDPIMNNNQQSGKANTENEAFFLWQ